MDYNHSLFLWIIIIPSFYGLSPFPLSMNYHHSLFLWTIIIPSFYGLSSFPLSMDYHSLFLWIIIIPSFYGLSSFPLSLELSWKSDRQANYQLLNFSRRGKSQLESKSLFSFNFEFWLYLC